jgi:pimeloyl-ACP methyl ester carboxylesterase
LGGYRLRAAAPKGYLLVAQGNAMLADQIMGELQSFRDRGFDVYVYDYRGYGLSEGRSRLTAIISDYREIIANLNAQPYHRHALYGMSMGGVILLNAVGESGDYSSLVIDSSPSRISPLGCPEQYDPINHLPADSSRLEIIAGGRDRVGRPQEIHELLFAANSAVRGSCSARSLRTVPGCHRCDTPKPNERSGGFFIALKAEEIGLAQAGDGRSARSGSPQCPRISARATSRSRIAAAQSVPSGWTSVPIVTATVPRRGNHWSDRRMERVPRMVTGTSGTPASAAATKAPM